MDGHGIAHALTGSSSAQKHRTINRINYILYDNDNDILQPASNIDSTGLYTNTLFADLALLAERWKTVHVPRAKCTGLNVLLL